MHDPERVAAAMERARTRLRDIVEAAYREGIEDGREGWYNENDHRAPTDDDLWRDSTAKHAANPGGES